MNLSNIFSYCDGFKIFQQYINNILLINNISTKFKHNTITMIIQIDSILEEK